MEQGSNCEHIGYKYYCVYCAKEVKIETHYEDYYEWRILECDCEGAKLEKQANELLAKANSLKKRRQVK